jgi:membrane-associated phospholipid phosphatase
MKPTIERIWLCYLAAVVLVAWLTPAPGGHVGMRAWHLLVHAGLTAAVLGVQHVAVRRGNDAARALRAALAVVGLPLVFSAMCWLLPAVHPEPYEYLWCDVDRAVFGQDIARAVDGALSPWFVELLQLDYACFYPLCLATVLLARRGGGGPAFDRALLLLVGSFLASYHGYLLVPTLAPKVVLADAQHVDGLWLTEPVRAFIDGAEANAWDCFPSGHTMMTLTSLIILWRWARRWFWWLLLPALLLIASTMLLRYHWAGDVLAGALCAWPCARLCDWLADLDGWPRPSAQSSTK